jgi:hypothetical protein
LSWIITDMGFSWAKSIKMKMKLRNIEIKNAFIN